MKNIILISLVSLLSLSSCSYEIRHEKTKEISEIIELSDSEAEEVDNIMFAIEAIFSYQNKLNEILKKMENDGLIDWENSSYEEKKEAIYRARKSDITGAGLIKSACDMLNEELSKLENNELKNLIITVFNKRRSEECYKCS